MLQRSSTWRNLFHIFSSFQLLRFQTRLQLNISQRCQRHFVFSSDEKRIMCLRRDVDEEEEEDSPQSSSWRQETLMMMMMVMMLRVCSLSLSAATRCGRWRISTQRSDSGGRGAVKGFRGQRRRQPEFERNEWRVFISTGGVLHKPLPNFNTNLFLTQTHTSNQIIQTERKTYLWRNKRSGRPRACCRERV